MFSSVRRLLVAGPSTLAIAAAALAAAPSAQADLINLNTCNTSTLSQPFSRWLDFASYELAPGGSFAGSSWSLSGGAQIVSGAEPYDAAGSPSSSSLSLPAGSSAESPATCVTAAYPDVRYFIGGTGVVAVSVVYNGLAIPAGTTVGTGWWAPSLPAVTASAITGALNGGTAQVSLRFTALLGNPKVSDVFIDPCRSG